MKLVKPSMDFKSSYMDGLREFQAEGLPWVMEKNAADIEANFADYVTAQLNKRTLWTIDTPVDETTLWAIDNGEFVGSISIRHRLNNDLQTMGGHIGYDTRPTRRRKGYASRMLEQALPIARSLGIQKALLTCNDSNIASIKVIERNGGVLAETKPQFEGGPMKRYYWIQL